MALTARRSRVWLGMILAGLTLGGYVAAAWPDATPRLVWLPSGEAMPKTPAATPQAIRTTASVRAYPESELAGVLGEAYPMELFFYEVSPAPLLDAVISGQRRVEVH